MEFENLTGLVRSISSDLGVYEGPLIEKLNKFYGETGDPEKALDRLEALLALWGSTDELWLRIARSIELARIYLESLNDYQRYNRRSGIERRLTWQALRLLRSRYLLRVRGVVRETPDQMVRRVVSYVSLPEYASGRHEELWRIYYNMISNLRFIPNSPTLMNAGTRYPQLAACFVVPLRDDIDGILDAVRISAWIFKSGAGAGYDFSVLRPKGTPIEGTGGFSSGPVSFMRIFDTVADVLREGGKRRAAMMGILHDWHPDIVEFINSKCVEGVFESFNISVGVHDEFLKGGEWLLYNPRSCEGVIESASLGEINEKCMPVGKTNARDILERISECAWKTGDPGVVFIDEINRHNPTPSLGAIHATNPCGETPLLDWEACNLGSLNLSKYVDPANNRILWEELAEDVYYAVRFLDNVIEVSWYPDKRIMEAVRRTRKIGLGVMGWADMLAQLGIPYDSNDAVYLGDKIMEFIAYHARKASNDLAIDRGPYPAFEASIHREGRFNFEPQRSRELYYDPSKISREAEDIIDDRPPLDWESVRREMMRGTRNATVTTIAPTGSISIIADASSSIEPFFALVYLRRSDIGVWIEVNKHLKKWLIDNDMLNIDTLITIARHGGGIRWAEWAPKELKERLPTALEIKWEWHVKMQGVFQRWVDNAVSKTINMPSTATVEDVLGSIRLAWRLGCKGITVYRDKSRKGQVLEGGSELEEALRKVPGKVKVRDKHIYSWLRIRDKEVMLVHEEYSGGCPTCDT